MHTKFSSDQPAPREGYAPVKNAQLYYRDIGQGQPINHSYLLPDMDRLSDTFRLIYYDQRGRGKPAGNVQPEDVSIESEIDDLEGLREYCQLGSVAVLGHSWGGVLAMEYAIRQPHRVSHLILMNAAPASHDDLILFRQERRKLEAGNLEELKVLSATALYEAGDLETDAEYYRIHFRATLRQPEHLERVVKSLRLSFTPESIRKARAIENRLYGQTSLLSQYDLLPKLERLSIPALVIRGDYDFVPAACAEHIAQAIPGARLVVLRECGHFAFLERPDEVRKALAGFLVKD